MLLTVVFDTNILISAILSQRGSPYRCLELAQQGVVASVTCQEIIDEFQEKLEIKFSYSRYGAIAKTKEFLSYSRLVKISNTLKVIAIDPDDNMILECAVVAGATYIVTGDRRHLLPLKNYQGIAIVSPSDLLTSISNS